MFWSIAFFVESDEYLGKKSKSMANTVPIIKSFIQAKYLADLIGRDYDLQGVSCQLIKATMRDVYLVQTNTEQYIACLYNLEQENHIQAEVDFIHYLAKLGIQTAEPVAQENGDYLLPVEMPEGRRYLVLFNYVDGKPFSRYPEMKDIAAYGKTLAQLHITADAITKKLARPKHDISYLLDKPLKQFELASRRIDILEELQRASNFLRDELENLSQETPTYGLIHGDVIPSNALISADDSLHIIDFDLCAYGWRMYDVAMFLNEAAFWGMGDGAEKAFLAGYESLRPIPDAEKATIPLFGAIRTIWALGNAAAHINTWGSHLYLSNRVVDGMMQNLRDNLAKL